MAKYFVISQEQFGDSSWEYPEPQYREFGAYFATTRGEAHSAFCAATYCDYLEPVWILRLPECAICQGEGHCFPDDPTQEPILCPACHGRSAWPGGFGHNTTFTYLSRKALLALIKGAE